MSCRKIQFLIQAYLDGESSAAESAAVERHVAACPECAADLASSRQLLSVLGASPQRKVSAGFEERLCAALAESRPKSGLTAWWERLRLQHEWRVRVPALVTSGSLAAALLAGLVTLRVQDQQQVQRERQEYLSTAVERYQQLQRADSQVNWDAVDASIELNSGQVITE